MTCPISPLTSSLFSLIRHGNLKATGNRSHVSLLVLYQCQLKCLKATRLISLIPKRMFICDHFPIVKLLCQQLIYKSDTYADICFGILHASWDSCPPALLVDLPFKLRAWWIITMDKPLWTYMVVRTPVMSLLEFTAVHSITEKLYSLETKPFTGFYQFLWSSYLGKILMPRMKCIKEQENLHPS